MGKRNSLLLHRISISKERFDLIPMAERLLFIRFGHARDEINSLLRVFLWSSSFDILNEEELNARHAQSLVFARVLTGKLYEAHKMIRNWYLSNRSIANKYNTLLNDETREALKDLNRYFGSNNLIKDVRKKYAFHYLHDEITKISMKRPTEDELVFYLCPDSRNHFYCSSDTIVNDAMLEAIEPDDKEKAQVRLQEETIKVTKWLLRFLQGYIDIFMKQYFGRTLKEMGAKKILIKVAPKEEDIVLPYFLAL